MGLLPEPELPQEERGELIQITGDIYWQNKFTNFYWYAGIVMLIVPPAGLFLLGWLAAACIVTNPDQSDA